MLACCLCLVLNCGHFLPDYVRTIFAVVVAAAAVVHLLPRSWIENV